MISALVQIDQHVPMCVCVYILFRANIRSLFPLQTAPSGGSALGIFSHLYLKLLPRKSVSHYFSFFLPSFKHVTYSTSRAELGKEWKQEGKIKKCEEKNRDGSATTAKSTNEAHAVKKIPYCAVLP
uniref:Uncharacterized protein n=1 Tax=Trypanosoma congolense (strain IL3000) TaxID=1068625 RepID=G0ULS5_TRYCI|nr:hypothetical protein, unlikely [Trypanosoma congolense IL3000]